MRVTIPERNGARTSITKEFDGWQAQHVFGGVEHAYRHQNRASLIEVVRDALVAVLFRRGLAPAETPAEPAAE